MFTPKVPYRERWFQSDETLQGSQIETTLTICHPWSHYSGNGQDGAGFAWKMEVNFNWEEVFKPIQTTDYSTSWGGNDAAGVKGITRGPSL